MISKRTKVNEAMKYARVKQTLKKTLSTEKQINALKISNVQKLELINQLKGGVRISHIKTTLVSTTGKPSKYLPNVKGEFFEFTSSTGNSLGRSIVGYTISKTSQKSFKGIVINQAIGKLKGKELYTYGKTFVGREQGTIDFLTGKPRTVYKGKIYTGAERIKILQQLKNGKTELSLSEFQLNMIGKPVKFRGGVDPKSMLGFAESFVMLRGKNALINAFRNASPYMRGNMFSITKTVSKTGKIKYVLRYTKTGQSVIVTESFIQKYGKGLGYAERIFEPPKVIKLPDYSAWSPKEIKLPKQIKYKQPKTFKDSKVSQLTELEQMKIYSLVQKQKGYGGVPAFATYEAGFVTDPFSLSNVLSGTLTGGLVGVGGVERRGVTDKGLVFTRDIIKDKVDVLIKDRRRVLVKDRLKDDVLLKYDLGLIQPLVTIQPTKTKTISMTKQLPVYRQQQIQKQKVIPKTIQNFNQAFGLGVTVPKISAPKIPIYELPYLPKETKKQANKRKLEELKIRRQQRAYQASVGAVALGITMTKKQLTQFKKRFTGLELRPIIRNNNTKRKPTKKYTNKNLGLSYSNSNSFSNKFNKAFQL